MAIDTRDKRFSILGIHQPVPSLSPNPDGAISTADRAMWAWLYHGITLSGAATFQAAWARQANIWVVPSS